MAGEEKKVTFLVAAEDAYSVTMANLKAALAMLPKDVLDSMQKTQSAFAALNIKSSLNIEFEKAKLVDAFNQIKNSGVASADDIKKAQTALHAKMDELDGKVQKSGTLLQELGRLAAGAFALNSIQGFITSSIQAELSLQKMESMFKAVFGENAAAREMAFTADLAKRLGLDILTTTESFGKFAAATKGTALEGEETRRVFTSVSTAAKALNLTTDETHGIFVALQQMMSKGKVSAEELTQQLGERLPGAQKLVAEAMGMTTAELNKQMQAGNVMAADMLPKLATQLEKTYGEAGRKAADNAASAITRFNNEVFLSKAALGESLMPALMAIMPAATFVANGLAEVVKSVQKIGVTAAYVYESIKTKMDLTISPAETKTKLTQLEQIWFQSLAEIDKNFEKNKTSFVKNDKEKVDEAARNAQRMVTDNKVATDTMAKSALEYGKVVGTVEQQIYDTYQKNYEEGKKDIAEYFANKLKAVVKGGTDEKALIAQKNDALIQLEKQHSADKELAALDSQAKLLKGERESASSQISVIKDMIAQHKLSQTEGSGQILALQQDLANKEKLVAENKFNIIAGLYKENTKEYQAALKQKEDATQKSTKTEIEIAQQVEKDRKLGWEISAATHKNALDKELLNIKEYHVNGNLSAKEAAVKRLEAESDYFEKIKKMRAEQLAALNPETQALEYQKALSAKLAADKQYEDSYNSLLNAKEKLDADNQAKITARHKEEIDKRRAAEQAAHEQQRAFAAGWFAMWDKAYNDGAASLSKLSDAAYNAFAAANDLPQKITESIASLKEMAAATEGELNAIGKAADLAALTSSNGFGKAYHDLQMISAGAKEVTLDFIDQKINALTLADALSSLQGATPGVIQAAEQSIDNFKLLDASTLDKLKGQIERLKGVVESFRDAIRSTVSSLQDELDNLTLSKASLETKKYEKQIDDLNEKIRQAVALNDTASQEQLRQAIENANKIHDIKMKNLAAEAAAAQNTTSANPNKNTNKQGFSRGGRFPGYGAFDTLQVWARPGEWFVQNEAADFWGDNFMAAVNTPWSEAGKAIQEQLSGLRPAAITAVTAARPTAAFSTGGKVLSPESSIEKPTMRVELVAPSGNSVKGDFSQSDARSFLDILQEAGLRTA